MHSIEDQQKAMNPQLLTLTCTQMPPLIADDVCNPTHTQLFTCECRRRVQIGKQSNRIITRETRGGCRGSSIVETTVSVWSIAMGLKAWFGIAPTQRAASRLAWIIDSVYSTLAAICKTCACAPQTNHKHKIIVKGTFKFVYGCNWVILDCKVWNLACWVNKNKVSEGKGNLTSFFFCFRGLLALANCTTCIFPTIFILVSLFISFLSSRVEYSLKSRVCSELYSRSAPVFVSFRSVRPFSRWSLGRRCSVGRTRSSRLVRAVPPHQATLLSSRNAVTFVYTTKEHLWDFVFIKKNQTIFMCVW